MMLKSNTALVNSLVTKGGVMPDHMYPLPNGDLFLDLRYKKVRIRESTRTNDLRIAERILATRKMEVDKGLYLAYKKKFGELCKTFEKKELPKKGESGQIDYPRTIKNHLLPYFKETKLGEIVKFDKDGNVGYETYLKTIKDKPKSTFNKIKLVLGWVIQMGLPDFKFPEKDKPGFVESRNRGFYQTRFLSEAEMLAIINMMSEKYRPIAYILAYTGIDCSEALGLRKRDFQNGILDLPRSKTWVARRIPIAEKLKPIFTEINNSRKLFSLTDDRIFPDHKLNGLKSAWKRARLKANIGWYPRLKDLRHFFISHLLNKNVDVMTVCRLAGHTDPKMIQERYGHYTDDYLREKMEVFG